MADDRMSARQGPVPGAAGSAGVADDSDAAQPAGTAMTRVDRQVPGPGEDAAGGRSAAAIRERAKERRLAERGDRILDALATLIARWGYGKTTVDDIAREAGVAKGTVYLHWPTKDAVLHALIEREERQWNALIVERMAANPRGGTLSSMYRHALALCMENPMLRALLTRDRDTLGKWIRSPQSRARYRRRMEGLHALLRELRAAGLLRTDCAVEVQAYLLTSLLYGILTVDDFLPADLVPPLEDVVDAFAVIVRRGFESELTDAEGAQALARGQAAIADLMIGLGGARAVSGPATQQSGPGHAPRDGQDSGDKESAT